MRKLLTGFYLGDGIETPVFSRRMKRLSPVVRWLSFHVTGKPSGDDQPANHIASMANGASYDPARRGGLESPAEHAERGGGAILASILVNLCQFEACFPARIVRYGGGERGQNDPSGLSAPD